MMTSITQLRWQRYADKYCWWLDNFTHYSCLLLLNSYCYFCCTDATMLFTQKQYHTTCKTIFSLQWFTRNKQCNFCNWELVVIPRQCNQEQTTFLTWNWIIKHKILHTLREWILQYLLAFRLAYLFHLSKNATVQ